MVAAIKPLVASGFRRDTRTFTIGIHQEKSPRIVLGASIRIPKLKRISWSSKRIVYIKYRPRAPRVMDEELSSMCLPRRLDGAFRKRPQSCIDFRSRHGQEFLLLTVFLPSPEQSQNSARHLVEGSKTLCHQEHLNLAPLPAAPVRKKRVSFQTVGKK